MASPWKIYPRIPKYVTDWGLYPTSTPEKPVTISMFGVEFSSLDIPSLSTAVASLAPILKPILNMLKAIQAILALVKALVTLDIAEITKIAEGLAETLLEVTAYFSQFTAAGFIPTAFKTVVSMLKFIVAAIEFIIAELDYLRDGGKAIDKAEETTVNMYLGKDALQEISDTLKRIKEENYQSRKDALIPFEIIGIALNIARSFLEIASALGGNKDSRTIPDFEVPEDVEEGLDNAILTLKSIVDEINKVIYPLDIF